MKQQKNKINRWIICILILALTACSNSSSYIHPVNKGDKQPGTVKIQDRLIPLEGQANFRDMGGYMTADNRIVVTGAVFRSGSLEALTGKDQETLKFLGIKTIVDFRTDLEICRDSIIREDKSDKLPGDIEYVRAIIDLDQEIKILKTAMTRGDWTSIDKKMMEDVFVTMATAEIRDDKNNETIVNCGTNPGVRESWKKAVRQLVDAEGPIVFHCSSGKDRTGFFMALFLTALGVPYETAVEDFLLTNDYLKNKHEAEMIHLNETDYDGDGIPGYKGDPTYFYILQKSYLDAAFDYIETNFGSVENYFKVWLELDDEDISILKEKYLDSTLPNN